MQPRRGHAVAGAVVRCIPLAMWIGFACSWGRSPRRTLVLRRRSAGASRNEEPSRTSPWHSECSSPCSRPAPSARRSSVSADGVSVDVPGGGDGHHRPGPARLLEPARRRRRRRRRPRRPRLRRPDRRRRDQRGPPSPRPTPTRPSPTPTAEEPDGPGPTRDRVPTTDDDPGDEAAAAATRGPRRRRPVRRRQEGRRRTTATAATATTRLGRRRRGETTTASRSRSRRSAAPTARRPTRTPRSRITDFGAAPIGVPNFIIDQFSIPPFLLPIYQACGTQYGDPVGGARFDQPDRDRLRHQPQRLHRRRARLDAVHPLELGGLRDRRQRRRSQGSLQPGRRDLRRGPLPQGGRRRGGSLPARSSPTTTPTGTSTRSCSTPSSTATCPSGLVDSLTGLTEGAHFPVAAKARYADDISERAGGSSGRRRSRASAATPPT